MKKYVIHWLRIALIIWTVLNAIYIFWPERVKANEFDYDNARNYLYSMKFTESQVDLVLEQEVYSMDHFVMWFGAINRHEVWWTFIDWETNYLAWRLKKSMYWKNFDTQLKWRVGAYNKYWYRHNTVNWRIDKSKYCVSDTHGWWHGCPNWKSSVPRLMSSYWKVSYTAPVETVETLQKNDVDYYKIAKEKQDKLNELIAETPNARRKCIDEWFCNQ